MESNNKFIDSLRQKDSITQNNAVTHSTTLNSLVDLFFIAGASRNMDEDSIISMLESSWQEDLLLTLKCIFWAGDIRQGIGERRFFRIALRWLNNYYSDIFDKIIELIPEYNRWDSLFEFNKDNIYLYIYKNLFNFKNALLAKWIPRKKQYNNFQKRFINWNNNILKEREPIPILTLTPKRYRKFISEYSKTVEQKMCNKQWNEIEYSKIPSCAFNKYRKAFFRNDEKRFNLFLEDVKKEKTKINANAIFPYQIYKSYLSGSDEKSIDLQWKSLPDYLLESNERIIPVCDVSGSMEYPNNLPMAISVSLGIYLSERNKSCFKDAFITFSSNPKMEYLNGTLTQKMRQLEESDWSMSTDLSAVFDLILNNAIKFNLSNEDMPTMILIISDMEFDQCGDLTNYENIKNKYINAGYNIPQIVFWNVNGRKGNCPVKYNEKNVALVSGASPQIMKSLLKGKITNSLEIVLRTLNVDRYNKLEEIIK